jgi:Domain of unknown function (DUF397)
MPFVEPTVFGWRKASICQDGECAEIAREDEEILLRSTRAPADVVRLTGTELQALIRGIEAGEFDFMLGHRPSPTSTARHTSRATTAVVTPRLRWFRRAGAPRPQSVAAPETNPELHGWSWWDLLHWASEKWPRAARLTVLLLVASGAPPVALVMWLLLRR